MDPTKERGFEEKGPNYAPPDRFFSFQVSKTREKRTAETCAVPRCDFQVLPENTETTYVTEEGISSAQVQGFPKQHAPLLDMDAVERVLSRAEFKLLWRERLSRLFLATVFLVGGWLFAAKIGDEVPLQGTVTLNTGRKVYGEIQVGRDCVKIKRRVGSFLVYSLDDVEDISTNSSSSQ